MADAYKYTERQILKYGYIYLLDGMADWEPGLAIAELSTGRFFKRNDDRLPVQTFALDRVPMELVRSVFNQQRIDSR